MFFGEILHFLCNRSHCWEFYTIPSIGQNREGGIWSKEGRRERNSDSGGAEPLVYYFTCDAWLSGSFLVSQKASAIAN